MSKSIMDIVHTHGQKMYALGLKHAIATIEILGDNALETLRKELEEEQKGVKDVLESQ